MSIIMMAAKKSIENAEGSKGAKRFGGDSLKRVLQ
jgi:hypothetical protein